MGSYNSSPRPLQFTPLGPTGFTIYTTGATSFYNFSPRPLQFTPLGPKGFTISAQDLYNLHHWGLDSLQSSPQGQTLYNRLCNPTAISMLACEIQFCVCMPRGHAFYGFCTLGIGF